MSERASSNNGGRALTSTQERQNVWNGYIIYHRASSGDVSWELFSAIPQQRLSCTVGCQNLRENAPGIPRMAQDGGGFLRVQALFCSKIAAIKYNEMDPSLMRKAASMPQINLPAPSVSPDIFKSAQFMVDMPPGKQTLSSLSIAKCKPLTLCNEMPAGWLLYLLHIHLRRHELLIFMTGVSEKRECSHGVVAI